MRNQAFKKLEQILEEAINARAESITLEYEDEGLAVYFMCGSTGIGNVFVDPVLESRIIRLIVDMAKLANKPKGTMVWTHLGKQYNIAVEEYDHFGESAFKLRLNETKP